MRYFIACLFLVTCFAFAGAPSASAATYQVGPTRTFSVPSVPEWPLKVCQSPVILRILATASDGWAPTPSQY